MRSRIRLAVTFGWRLGVLTAEPTAARARDAAASGGQLVTEPLTASRLVCCWSPPIQN